MADSWSYKTDAGTVLPVLNSDLKAYAQSGQILPDTPLRKDNGPWTLASKVKGLTWPDTVWLSQSGQPAAQSTSSSNKFQPAAHDFSSLKIYATICQIVGVISFVSAGPFVGLIILGLGTGTSSLAEAVAAFITPAVLVLNGLLLLAFADGLRGFIQLVTDTRQSREVLQEMFEATKGP